MAVSLSAPSTSSEDMAAASISASSASPGGVIVHHMEGNTTGALDTQDPLALLQALQDQDGDDNTDHFWSGRPNAANGRTTVGTYRHVLTE